MVYHLAGGDTSHDPSLKAEPSNTWEAMEGDFLNVVVNDPTPDGVGRISEVTYHVGRPIRVDENIPTKIVRRGPGIKRAKLLDVDTLSGSLDFVNIHSRILSKNLSRASTSSSPWSTIMPRERKNW